MTNGKVYVGQTTQTIKERWGQHKSASKKARLPISRAIRKYGSGAFSVLELEQCSDSDTLNRAESKWIAAYRSNVPGFGYNCTNGGEGFKMTDITKKRLSEAQKLIYLDPERRRQISELEKKRCAENPEHRARLAEMSRNYNGSAEGRAVHSVRAKEVWSDPDMRRRMSQAQRLSHQKDPGRRALFAVTARKASKAYWKQYRDSQGGWATEAEAHNFIQGLSVVQYNLKRKGSPRYPKQSLFPSIYGKTFQEVRDGSRRGVWVSEDTLRQTIAGLSQTSYEMLKKQRLLDSRYPQVPSLRKVYGKTYKEIRDGVRRQS
jgi:group I intron endonuclease